MNFLQEIQKIAGDLPGELKEDRGEFTLEYVVAERRAFLSRKKLVYRAKFRIDDQNREVRFTELLKERGFGLSSGDADISPGFGFKKETYKVGAAGREGTIEEQSDLFGRKYDYKFDFAKVRKQLEEKARGAGYKFTYKISSLGL